MSSITHGDASTSPAEAGSPPSSEIAVTRPKVDQPNALANEVQNKGHCSYYYKDRAREVAQKESALAGEPVKEVTIAIEDWSWRDVDDKHVKLYAHFADDALDSVDEETDIDCEVGGVKASWNRIPLNMWVNTHREDGKRHLLHIPKLYERICHVTCIKKRTKIMLVLEKAKYEAWPELQWDESRDERIEKPRGPPTNPLGLYDSSYRDERQTQYRR